MRGSPKGGSRAWQLGEASEVPILSGPTKRIRRVFSRCVPGSTCAIRGPTFLKSGSAKQDPPVSLALGSACFVPGPPWQRRGDAEQALGPFPAGCWQRIRTGPRPAAAQCYLSWAAATSGHTCTANSCLFFAFRLTVRNHGFRSWSWHPLRILNVVSSGPA